MGLYNLRTLGNQDQALAKNRCCACNMEMHPVIDEASRDSFDYICPNCNPSVIISVSGSVLASDGLEKLEKDANARAELQADIGICKKRYYPLVHNQLDYFLGTSFNSDIPYTFQDWYSGNISPYPNLYKGIQSDVLEAITIKQKVIFEEAVSSFLSELTKRFEELTEESINRNALLDSEIFEISRLLNGDIKDIKGITRYGQIEVANIDVSKIQNFYKDAVYSRLDYHCIPSPNQIWRIGTSKKKFELMTIAVAANKYLKFLKDKKSESTKSFAGTMQNKRIELLKQIYFECSGLISNNLNINVLAQKLSIDVNEINDIAESLADFNYIKFLTKDRDLCLTLEGIQLIEGLSRDEESKRGEGFSPQEIKEINIKLDRILEELDKLDLGHEVIFDEIDSLRNDAKRLSKKDFKSMAMGKLFSLGVDGLLHQSYVVDFLKELVGNDLNKYLK